MSYTEFIIKVYKEEYAVKVKNILKQILKYEILEVYKSNYKNYYNIRILIYDSYLINGFENFLKKR